MAGVYKDVRKHYCSDAQSSLGGAFIFDGSPEGGAFWYGVCSRLRELAAGVRPTEPFWKNDVMDRQVAQLNIKIAELQKEITSQATTIVDLRSKLLRADFANMAGNRRHSGL